MATQKKKAKKEPLSKKKKIIIIMSIVLVLMIVATVFYAVPTILSSRRGNVADQLDGEYISQLEDEDEAMLFAVDSGEIKSLNALSGSGYIVTSSSLVSFKKDGSVIDVTKTGYSSPVTKTAGKYYIDFERSTGKYTILNKNGTVYSSQLEGEIINADIAANGSYVIITRKTLSTLLVTVYSPENEILFQWECNDTYLTNCAISPSGKKIAVAAFDVVKGEQTSKILTFTTKSVDVEKETKGSSDVIYSMKFMNNDSLSVITDKRYMIFNTQTGDTLEADYEYDEVSSCFFGSNSNVAVLKSSFGSLDGSSISVYDRNAQEIFSCETDDKVIDFCFDKSFVYVLSSCKITVYAISTGEKYTVIEAAGGLKHINVISGGIFCTSDTEVYKYDR